MTGRAELEALADAIDPDGDLPSYVVDAMVARLVDFGARTTVDVRPGLRLAEKIIQDRYFPGPTQNMILSWLEEARCDPPLTADNQQALANVLEKFMPHLGWSDRLILAAAIMEEWGFGNG